MSVDRRDFMKNALVTAGGVLASAYGRRVGAADGDKDKAMIKRTLGKTGQKLSIVGFGGIVVMNAEPQQAARVVADAVERGITYFDVAPSYGDAEVKLGPALKPFRDKVFLACKTGRRDRQGAEQELQQSLKRLQTDHFDLYQLHGISDVEKDVKAVLAKGGAMEAILAAQKAGVIRNIGFSAHTPEAALAAMSQFDFASVMYPINFVCHFRSGFDKQVIAEAKKRGLGIIALKSMARQKWPADAERQPHAKCWYQPIADPDLARLAASWSLEQGITAILPPGEESLFRMALDLAPNFRKPTKAELARLEEVASQCAPLFSA